ncbi:MAG: TolC family protein [Deltaproteobacteria bacterium]|nr:TolC family protein [Deltaproteobacteria bacterium]
MTKRKKSGFALKAFFLSILLHGILPAPSQCAEMASPAPGAVVIQPGEQNGEKPLTVDEAVRIALENHPRIKTARERVGAQQAVLGQQLGAYYPTISFNNQYRTSTASGTTGVSPEASESYSSQATFNLTLYNFGKREGAVQSARETLDATRYNFTTAIDDTVVGVKQAYYLYLAAKALVRVREEAVKSRDLIVRQAQGFYDVGTRAKIDVVRAEANLYTAQADLIAAENGAKVAWVTLKNAMGLLEYPERPVTVDLTIAPVPITLERAKDIAFSSRPELKSLEAQRKAQDQQIATARRGHLPDIIFDAFYGRRNSSDTGSDTFPLKPVWQVQLGLNIPIFDGFRTTYRVEETTRNYYAIKAQEEQQKEQVALEVEQNYLRLDEARERIKATAASERAAKENLDLANGRYQVGVGSIIEVTDAQSLYTDAQTNHIRAQYDYKIAEAQLIRAIGRPL